MNHLNDCLCVELQLAISDMESYAPGRPWYFLESWKLPIRWAKLIEQAERAGWGAIISDDGKSVSIHHRGKGLNALFERRAGYDVKDEAGGRRCLLVLKAMLTNRETELIEAKPLGRQNDTPEQVSIATTIAGPKKRRGRLTNEESKLLRTSALAQLREHPTLADDPAKLALLVGTSEATARRMIDGFCEANLRRKQ